MVNEKRWKKNEVFLCVLAGLIALEPSHTLLAAGPFKHTKLNFWTNNTLFC